MLSGTYGWGPQPHPASSGRPRVRAAHAALWAALALTTCGSFAAPSAGATLPIGDDIAPLPESAREVLRQSKAPLLAPQSLTGGGFTMLSGTTWRNRPTYVIRLVANNQGNVEALRSAAETAAAEISASSDTDITVAPGTVPDTTPDREPAVGEIVLSVDATTPCTPPIAGCGGPRLLESHPYSGRTTINGGRAWIHPDALAYTSHNRQHVVSHEIGHAIGLGHHDALFEGQVQMMHSSSYQAGTYQSGDRNGFAFLAGKPMPRPAPVVMPNGDEYVFYRGSDARLRAWFWDGSAWSSKAWGASDSVAGDVTAVVTTNGVAEAYFRTTSGQIGQWRITASSASFVVHGAANVTGNPTAVADSSGGTEVFYRMSTGVLGRGWFNGPNWNFTPWGYATVSGSPFAVRDANGVIEVLHRTTSNTMARWRFFAAGGFQDLSYAPANVGGDPTAAVTGGTTVNSFYRTSSGDLGRWWFNAGSWNNTVWGASSIAAASRPWVVAAPGGSLDVFYRTTTGALGRYWFSGNDWNPSTVGYNGELDGDPAAAVKASKVHVFFGGPDGRFRVYSYEPGSSWWSWNTIG